MLYKVVLGDWSGDGHEKTVTYKINIPNELANRNILSQNYQKNRTIAGFGYEDIAKKYDDISLKPKHLKGLMELGFNFIPFEDGESFETLPFDTISVELLDELEQDQSILEAEVHLGIEADWGPEYTYLKIVLFMIGHGLPDWRWEIVEDKTPSLLSNDDDKALPHGGYGLFFTT